MGWVVLCVVLAAVSVSLVVAAAAAGENTTDDVDVGGNVTKSPLTGGLAEVGEQQPELEFLGPSKQPLRGSRLQMPCSCGDMTCGCCVGMRVQALGFERNACMNLTYEPYDFAIEANFLMDDESLFRRSISAKNPPPLCMPVPVPVLPTLDVCVRLFDVYTPGVNLHACLDLEARLVRAPLLVLHFDCMVMGRDGISLVKPGESELPVEPADPGGDDFYDEVTEDRTRGKRNQLTSTVTDTQLPTSGSPPPPDKDEDIPWWIRNTTTTTTTPPPPDVDELPWWLTTTSSQDKSK